MAKAKKNKKPVKIARAAKTAKVAKKPVKTAKKTLTKKSAKPVAKAAKKTAAKPTQKVSPRQASRRSSPQPQRNQASTSRNKSSLQDFVTPLDDRLLVRVEVKDEKRTAGGLYIPETAQSTVKGHLRGFVVALGRGHRDPKGRLRPMDVQIGDEVIFPEYGGNKITIQGEEMFILRESEVMGVLI